MLRTDQNILPVGKSERFRDSNLSRHSVVEPKQFRFPVSTLTSRSVSNFDLSIKLLRNYCSTTLASAVSVMSKLKGKVALITGASSGIGAATAIMLSKHGATLAISGRNVDNLNKTAGLCQVEEGQQSPLIIQGIQYNNIQL